MSVPPPRETKATRVLRRVLAIILLLAGAVVLSAAYWESDKIRRWGLYLWTCYASSVVVAGYAIARAVALLSTRDRVVETRGPSDVAR